MSFEDLMPEVNKDRQNEHSDFKNNKVEETDEIEMQMNKFKRIEELIVFEETHFMNHILETIYAHLKKNEILIFSS